MKGLSLAIVMLINICAAWLWLRWLHTQDVYAVKKRQRKIVPLYFVAGLLSAPVSLAFYALNPYELLATGWTSYSFLVIAPSEELCKFLVFRAIAKLTGSVKDPMDAAIQGASVGLGFAIAENFVYGLYVDPFTMVIRGLLAMAGHGTFTAVSAFSWGASEYYLGRKRQKGTWGFAVFGLCLAILTHGLYDAFLGGYFNTMIPALCLDAAYFAAFASALSDGRKLSPYYNLPLAEWQKAVTWIEYGLGRDPDNWILYQRRGMYLLRGGYIENAAEDFAQACELGEDSFPRAWQAVVARIQGTGTEAVLEETLRRLGRERRAAFLNILRRVLRASQEGAAALKETAAIIRTLDPPPPPRRSRLSIPDQMDRSPEALAKARELRARGRAKHTGSRLEHRQAQASRRALRDRVLARKSGLAHRQDLPTSKERAFAYLLQKRKETRLMV